MNNRGWGLTTMLALCGVLALALIISAIVYQQTFNDTLLPNENHPNNGQEEVNATAGYRELEKKVVDSAITYFDKYYPTLPEDDKVYVSVKKLKVEKMLDSLIDKSNNECIGYASYEIEEGTGHYQAYIKCGSRYRTTGYRSEYDK